MFRGADSEDAARALSVAALTTGAGPLLGLWVEAGGLSAPRAAERVLDLHLRHGRARALRVRELLTDLAELLAGLDARPVVLKGVHTAWTVFPEPGCRCTADVDLLIRSRALPLVERALEGAGYGLVRRQRGPDRSVWSPPGCSSTVRSLEVNHVQNPLTVDIHENLERDLHGANSVGMPAPDWSECVAVPGLPGPFRGLPHPHLLMSLAIHASEDLRSMQLVRFVELALVARTMGASEWGQVSGLGVRTASLRHAYPALALAARLAPDAVPLELLGLASESVPRHTRALVDQLTPGTAQRLDGLAVDERFFGVGTGWELLSRLGQMLLPGRAGGSPRELARIYLERMYTLARGRLRIRSRRATEK